MGGGIAEQEWAGGCLCGPKRSLPDVAAPTPPAVRCPQWFSLLPRPPKRPLSARIPRSPGAALTHRSQCIKYIRIPLPFAQKQVENIMEGVEDWKPHCNPSVALAAPSSWPFPQLGEELSFHCCWKTVWTLERTVFRPTRTNGPICVVRAELSGPALPLSGV